MINLMPYINLLLRGALVTLQSWMLAYVLSLVIGITLGTLGSRYLVSRFGFLKHLSLFIRMYTFITKGIPAYVQILIAYFVVPEFFGFNISGFASATCALALCSSGYVTEIIRSGIDAIPRGQWEAALVLGYSLKNTLYRIIFPQVLKTVLVMLLGEAEQLLKSTSLLATIGVTELTRSGMNIISRELDPLPVYCLLACIYLFFSACITVIAIFIERRKNYGNC